MWATLVNDLSAGYWSWEALTLIAGAAVAAPAARATVRRGWARGPIGELVAFWATGLILGVGVSAFLGAAGVTAVGLFPEIGFGLVWGAYWASAAFGTVVFAPLVTRVTWSLAQRGEAREAPLDWRHAVWAAALALLVLSEYAAVQWGSARLSTALIYLYFPLLAVCAGLGAIRFTDAMTAAICTAMVALSLAGGAGLARAQGNADVLETVVLVIAVTLTTQLVGAMAEVLRRQTRAARAAARRDFLTTLGNDRELAHRLAEWRGRGAAVALLDVPAARRALDLLGLERANEVERRVADKLARCGNDATSISRIGRGLYALYWLTGSPTGIERALRGCYDALNGTRHAGSEVSLTLRPSAGALLLDDRARTADDVMAMASQTLHHAQAMSGERLLVRRAHGGLLESARSEELTAERIRSALGRPDGFALLAQPIVPLAPDGDATPFHEVLLRLRDDDGGAVSPGEFLGVAARHGLMPEIDRWVTQQAFATLERSHLCLSINVSGATLTDPNLLDWIDAHQRQYALDPTRLCFEVTETESIEGFDRAEANCRGLRERGFRLALDDFGTGLASFEYVRRFPFDFVKIDGSFVRGAETSRTEQAMIRSIALVAATAGLQTVAEFVESEGVRDWLAGVGVDYGQGFGIGRPRPLADVAAGDPQPRQHGAAERTAPAAASGFTPGRSTGDRRG